MGSVLDNATRGFYNVATRAAEDDASVKWLSCSAPLFANVVGFALYDSYADVVAKIHHSLTCFITRAVRVILLVETLLVHLQLHHYQN